MSTTRSLHRLGLTGNYRFGLPLSTITLIQNSSYAFVNKTGRDSLPGELLTLSMQGISAVHKKTDRLSWARVRVNDFQVCDMGNDARYPVLMGKLLEKEAGHLPEQDPLLQSAWLSSEATWRNKNKDDGENAPLYLTDVRMSLHSSFVKGDDKFLYKLLQWNNDYEHCTETKADDGEEVDSDREQDESQEVKLLLTRYGKDLMDVKEAWENSIEAGSSSEAAAEVCAWARAPRTTDGGNEDESAHHRAACMTLWRSHCEAGIGRMRPINYFR